MTELVVRYRAGARISRIRIDAGGLARLGVFARGISRAGRAVLVSDRRVAALHGARALRALERSGFSAALVALPAGERTKRAAALVRLWERFASAEIDRHDLVVALGGGVIGDLAGFASATFLRGVDWMIVPTTLLAQVDSSVGGKTAIDLPAGKNLVGAFHQPLGVLVDPDLLRTLPPRQRRAGLAEVVKTGMAADAGLFAWIDRRVESLAAGDAETLAGAVERTLRAKARIVARDEREAEGGGRSALNYGHTLGHALEAAHGYRRLLHGEAVAIGMRVAGALSQRAAGLAPESRAAQDAMLDRLGLPGRMPPTPLPRLLAAMRQDKKRAAGGVRWVLTPRVGHASVPRLISGRLVRAALLEAGALA